MFWKGEWDFLNDAIQKYAKDLNLYFLKEDLQMANKHMETKYYLSLDTTSHQQDDFIIIITIIILGQETATIGEDVKKVYVLFTFGRNVKWCSCLRKQFGSSSRSKTQSYHMTQQCYSQVYNLGSLSLSFTKLYCQLQTGFFLTMGH